MIVHADGGFWHFHRGIERSAEGFDDAMSRLPLFLSIEGRAGFLLFITRFHGITFILFAALYYV